jgi:hypothetical protein
MEVNFKKGDKVKTPFGIGEVWKVTIESVHVKHTDDKGFFFSKYLYSPYHHTQNHISYISHIIIKPTN